ncbi:unnamed protein product [Acanthosepion pharaonis]|uniref:Uncharacterized protein n=1 Tax=Acanthosepion pharaonis TaxID=158019 RepID=A0A812CN85_ACAPH|nr:unnamed protein product [Sepia pharaonis]
MNRIRFSVLESNLLFSQAVGSKYDRCARVFVISCCSIVKLTHLFSFIIVFYHLIPHRLFNLTFSDSISPPSFNVIIFCLSPSLLSFPTFRQLNLPFLLFFHFSTSPTHSPLYLSSPTTSSSSFFKSITPTFFFKFISLLFFFAKSTTSSSINLFSSFLFNSTTSPSISLFSLAPSYIFFNSTFLRLPLALIFL